MLGLQLAFDVTGDPEFPERAAFDVARDLGVPVTTHAGVWNVTKDDSIRLMHENGFMTPSTIYVHAASLSQDSYHRIAATGGTASVATESEQSAGQGYPPTWRLRDHGIPVSLSQDTSVWWSGDLFSAMRTTLGADRAREHLEAHGRQETVTHCRLRAEEVVDWATRGGARALGLDSVAGSLEPGKKADVVLIKNDPGQAGGGGDGRVPAGPARPGGLERGHAPGDPGDPDAQQSLHLRRFRPVDRQRRPGPRVTGKGGGRDDPAGPGPRRGGRPRHDARGGHPPSRPAAAVPAASGAGPGSRPGPDPGDGRPGEPGRPAVRLGDVLLRRAAGAVRAGRPGGRGHRGIRHAAGRATGVVQLRRGDAARRRRPGGAVRGRRAVGAAAARRGR